MLELVRTIADERVPVLFHDSPHPDELVALLMLEEHGTIELLEEVCGAGGVLALGCEGGPLDEHRETPGLERQDCCATLVAKKLGLMDDPAWKALIAFTYLSDTGQQWNSSNQSRHVYDIGNLIKMRWRYYQGTIVMTQHVKESIVNLCLADLRTFLWSQRMFCAASDEIEKQGRAETVENGPYVILVHSDNFQANAAARAEFKAEVIVVRNSTGHVHIFAYQPKQHRGSPEGFDRLAAALSAAELWAQNKTPDLFSGDGVTTEGPLPDGCWYYHRPFAIHNSTESYPDYPATQLHDDEIMAIIHQALRDTKLVRVHSR